MNGCFFVRERFLNQSEQYRTQLAATQTDPRPSVHRAPYRPRRARPKQHVLHTGFNALGAGNLVDRPCRRACCQSAPWSATVGHDIAQTIVNTRHAHVRGTHFPRDSSPRIQPYAMASLESINGRAGRIIRKHLACGISSSVPSSRRARVRWLNAMRAQCLAPAFLTPHARKRALRTRDKVHGFVPPPQQVLDHLARTIELVVIDRRTERVLQHRNEHRLHAGAARRCQSPPACGS